MSLRDLATTSLCAPTGNTVGGTAGASSSSNPLARLAEAVLPTSAPASRNAASQASALAYGPRLANPSTEITPEEALLLHGELSNQTAVPPPLSVNQFVQQPARPLPTPPPMHHVPIPVAAPPVPLPAVGAPTDLFERAFLSAATSVTAHKPANPHSASAPQAHTPFTHAHLPPPLPSHAVPPLQHAPWRQMQSSFAAISLHAPQQANPYPSYMPQQRPYSTTSSAPPAHVPNMPPIALQQAQPASQQAPAENVNEASQVTADNVVASEQALKAGTVPHSVSWGDEFTSLESAEHPLTNVDPLDDLLLEDTLQSAFQNWLRRDRSATYEFMQNHTASGRSAVEALAEGIRAHSEGRLSSVVYHLEDALNRSENATEALSAAKRAQAWYVLGISLADLDDDERAIQALSQGVSAYDGAQVGLRREDNPFLWQSLIALAVSYTNELEHTKALRSIREWLELRTSAGDGEAGIPNSVGDVDLFRRSDHDDLLNGLDGLAAQSPNDVDIFVTLGILHNLNRDYAGAAGALRHAVTLRPAVPNLWNKLGATLANGGDSDNALRAYRKAVDLQPALVRAWVNVGTAYSNRGEFAKAMRYYLKAISMSVSNSESGTSVENNHLDSILHVWGYLRSTLLSMSRAELLPLVEKRDVDGLRKHFNF